MIDTFKRYIDQKIWQPDLTSLSPTKVKLVMFLRIMQATIRDLMQGNITLQAMSLVYTTLLSLVPLLAVSFSVLKGFGVHNQIEPLLLSLLSPLGDKGIEITTRIIDFVENIKVGVLGSVGLGFLIYTVSSLLQKIERAFNSMWHIKESRPFAQRFSEYLSVVMVGPVLVFSAVGLTATLSHASFVQTVVAELGLTTIVTAISMFLPYLLIIIAFTFLYIFIPNTRVHFKSALYGAIISGILWESMGWTFASFIVTSTKYTAIYSGFAILVLFMIWLYISWAILLIGASISFYHQHPEHLLLRPNEIELSSRMKERLALLIMVRIGEQFQNGGQVWSQQALAKHLTIPLESIEPLIMALEKNGLIIRTQDTSTGYVPAKSLDTILIKDVLTAIRQSGEGTQMNPSQFIKDKKVDDIFNHIEQATHQAVASISIKELLTDTLNK